MGLVWLWLWSLKIWYGFGCGVWNPLVFVPQPYWSYWRGRGTICPPGNCCQEPLLVETWRSLKTGWLGWPNLFHLSGFTWLRVVIYICYITLMSVIDSYWCYMQFSSPRMLRLLFEGPATTSDKAKAVSQYWHWSPHSPYLCEIFCRPLAWLLRNSTDDPATMRYVTCRVWVEWCVLLNIHWE